MIRIKVNEKPVLKACEMNCDKPLHSKLEKYELTKFLNKHSSNIMIGRPGSGKSSILNSFFSSILKKVYHKVFLFIPNNSRASVKDSPFENILEEQQFGELTLENLENVMSIIKSSDKSKNNIIIFDDMTSHLKNPEVLKQLRELMMNKRHLRTSIVFLVQSFKSVDKTMRKLFDNFFIFKVSKEELMTIGDEIIEINKDVLMQISKMVYTEPYKYLFYNSSSERLFDGFDEIIIE
jgi:energy-coupling factor transporter ATP-binding protein EcfA2